MLTITEEERQEIDLAKRLAQAAVAEEQSRVKSEYIEEKVQKQIAKGNIPEGDDFGCRTKEFLYEESCGKLKGERKSDFSSFERV
jgi:hypothetical protein